MYIIMPLKILKTKACNHWKHSHVCIYISFCVPDSLSTYDSCGKERHGFSGESHSWHPKKAPGPPKKLRNHCAGCGLAWSSGIFRQLVHAKQLRSAGYVESGEKWEYKGEGLTKWYWLMDRILWAAAKIANIQLKRLKKVINHTQK